MRRRMAAGIAMVLLALLLGTARTEAAEPTALLGSVDPVVRGAALDPLDLTARPAVDDRPVLIGDSIAHSVAAAFARRHPEFVVDAVPGRRVLSLPNRLRLHLRDVGVPRTLVVEMGTNTVGSWTKTDFQEALSLVPSTTKVVLVTPYVRKNHLSPALPRGALAATRTRQYAAWEYQIAEVSPHVCVDPWRATVARRPGLLTAEGVHPTATGRRVFLRLLDQTLTGC